MPTRESAAEAALDQQLLDAIPKTLSQAEAQEAVTAVKKRREEELSQERMDRGILPSARKRARIQISDREFTLPARASAAESARDMELLAAIPSGLSRSAAEQAFASVMKQRDQEIASGVRSLEPTARQPARVSRKRTQSVAEPSAHAPVLESLLDGEHARFLNDALAHEALRCFNLTAPHTQYRLLHD